MPVKIRPSDWDRLFAPNAPRRGGPLRALVNVLITIVLIVLLSAGGVYAVNYRNKQIADANATATAIAPTIVAIQTQTAQAIANATATRVAQRTATAI
ncbi:MAG TPA: SH3 domain-containing protein, partial [Roseiflexaceae bacterium]